MPSSLPQFTTILLLIHMGFGCCLHHEHACETNCCSTPAATAVTCPCGTHCHDDVPARFVVAFGSFAEGGHQGEQHQCTGEHCTFVYSQPSPEHVGEFMAAICPLEVVVAESDARPCGSSLAQCVDESLPIAGASLRAHLVLRILLI